MATKKSTAKKGSSKKSSKTTAKATVKKNNQTKIIYIFVSKNIKQHFTHLIYGSTLHIMYVHMHGHEYMLLVLSTIYLLAKQQITHNNIHSHGTQTIQVSNAAATHSAQYHGCRITCTTKQNQCGLFPTHGKRPNSSRHRSQA